MSAFREWDVAGPHQAVLDRDAKTIQFDSDAPIALDFPAIGLRLSPDGQDALVEHHETGDCYVIQNDGLIHHVAASTGLYSAAWMPSSLLDALIIQRADETGVDVYDVAGNRLRTIPAPYSATGIAYLTPQGDPVMTTDPRCTRTINGVALFNVSESPDGWLVALADGGGPIGCLVRVSPQGVMEMSVLSVNVQLPPRVAEGGVCCWSGENAPDPSSLKWEPYQPWVEPVPTLTIPAQPRSVLRMGYGSPPLPASNVSIPCDGAPYLTGEEGGQ